MKIAKRSILFFLISSLNFVAAEGDMVIRGETMRHDTKEDITTAEGGAGLATTDWGANQTLKKLQAKKIRAKMSKKNASANEGTSDKKTDVDALKNDEKDSINSLGQDIEWIECIDQVQVTFPSRIMTADYCKSHGKKINCTGNVTIISGKNHVKGDTGSFDLEKDQYEISSNPANKKQVEVTLYSADKQTEETPYLAATGA